MTTIMLFTAAENAINKVISDFQANLERFWNERDLHWSLFHYLKLEQVIEEAYPTQLIRAEFPTLKVFPGNKPARGHYDLVILDTESYFKPEAQKMKAQAPWQEYLESLKISVVIEIKLWLNRFRSDRMVERIDWDIQKLTDTPNKIYNAYFLNFVQFNFKARQYIQFYQQLREHLSDGKRKHPNLNILCVPSDSRVQNNGANWL